MEYLKTMIEDHQQPEPLETQLMFEWEPIDFKIYKEDPNRPDKQFMPYFVFSDLVEYYCQTRIAEDLDKVRWRASDAYDLYTQNSTFVPDKTSKDS